MLKTETKKEAPIVTVHDFQERLRAHGVETQVLWVEKGPDNTRVRTHAMLIALPTGVTVYFQSFHERGWEAFVPAFLGNDVAETIQGVLTACRPKTKVFTVFCRQSNGRGTTWISNILDAEDVQDAREKGLRACAEDWGQDDTDGIDVLGIAEGDVTILERDDDEC